MSFDNWKAGQVQATVLEVPVVVPEIVESPQLRATLRGIREPVYSVAIAPDGRTLAFVEGRQQAGDLIGQQCRRRDLER